LNSDLTATQLNFDQSNRIRLILNSKRHILSDSSTEEESATPEQRTNHQLRRRIRHLEHNLRDITARCSAERERHMNLEALVGGKIFILI
jgi:hypothetical protein